MGGYSVNLLPTNGVMRIDTMIGILSGTESKISVGTEREREITSTTDEGAVFTKGYDTSNSGLDITLSGYLKDD